MPRAPWYASLCANWLIIGYGNALRADDAAGLVVVERLESTLTDQQDIEFITTMQLLPELSEPLSRAQQVIFVDASVEVEPGSYRVTELLPDKGIEERPPALLHHCTPVALMRTAHMLYGHAPRAWLYEIGVASLEHGAALTEAAGGAVKGVVAQISEQF